MELCPPHNCLSCQACVNACPFHAIKMEEDDLGIKLPRIMIDRCKNCGLCKKACPVLSPVNRNTPRKAIALYSKDKTDVRTCSSGGAATAISRYFITKLKGAVFGAAFIDGYPQYIKVEKVEELELLKGSKYVFCDPQYIYQEVKESLKEETKCLFIGLPCHVAALRRYLNKVYDNLYTIDLICHGTPPFAYLKQHVISKCISFDDVSTISFRGKEDFKLVICKRKNGVLYKRDNEEDEYFTAFMDGMIHREICYRCEYACLQRVSDMTIGDFWGLDSSALNSYRGKKSLALLNTKKGETLFNSVMHLFVWEERSVDEAYNGNEQLRRPTGQTIKREIFSRLYKQGICWKDICVELGLKQRCTNKRIKNIILLLPRKIKHKLFDRLN